MSSQPYPPDPRTQNYPPEADTVPYNTSNMRRSVNGDGASVEGQRESYVDPAGNQIENRVEVYEDRNLQKANLRNWITGIIYFLLGVLEVILGLRFIFRLLGANQGNDFTLFLYNLSHVFVGPFNNIFNDQTIGSISVFEVSTLVAMLIYALIGWGLVALTRVLLAPTYNGQRVATTSRRQR